MPKIMRIAVALLLLVSATTAQPGLPVGRSYATLVTDSPLAASKVCLKASDLAHVRSLCPVHRVAMVPTDIPAPWGHTFLVEFDPVWRSQFEAARATQFPFAYQESSGQGSCITPPECITTVAFVCPECRQSELRWRQGHPSQGPPSGT